MALCLIDDNALFPKLGNRFRFRHSHHVRHFHALGSGADGKHHVIAFLYHRSRLYTGADYNALFYLSAFLIFNFRRKANV